MYDGIVFYWFYYRLYVDFFFLLVFVCLLEVNIIIISLVVLFRYDKINDLVLKFVVGDEIIMYCNYGYKVVYLNLIIVCKDENNGSWSYDFIECYGMYLNVRYVIFYILL